MDSRHAETDGYHAEMNVYHAEMDGYHAEMNVYHSETDGYHAEMNAYPSNTDFLPQMYRIRHPKIDSCSSTTGFYLGLEHVSVYRNNECSFTYEKIGNKYNIRN